MSTPGAELARRFRKERRVARRSAAARAIVRMIGWGAPAAVLIVLHARLTLAARDAAWSRFVWAWTLIVAGAAAGALCSFLLRRPQAAALAQDLDRRHAPGRGLFAAAASLLDARAIRPPLGEVVLTRADRALAQLPILPAVRHARVHVKRTLVFFLLAALLALLPGGPRGALAGIGGGDGSAAAGDPAAAAPADGAAAAAGAPDSRADAATPLDDLAALLLASDHQIYGLDAEINLTLALDARRDFDADVPLDVVLAITDGLPSPDVGFGPGYRPVPLRLDWSLPKRAGERLKQTFPMRETLQALGLHAPGLLTARAFARPKDDGGPVAGGVGSNEITFQITERKEDLKTEVPQPQGEEERRPEAKTPKPPESQDEGVPAGGSKPELGERDRLPDAQRIAALIQPILNAGPTIEKDVSVFEREPGGPPAPLPITRKPLDATPSRTFLRRPEAPSQAPDLDPEERDVLRRYFESIRGQRKL